MPLWRCFSCRLPAISPSFGCFPSGLLSCNLGYTSWTRASFTILHLALISELLWQSFNVTVIVLRVFILVILRSLFDRTVSVRGSIRSLSYMFVVLYWLSKEPGYNYLSVCCLTFSSKYLDLVILHPKYSNHTTCILVIVIVKVKIKIDKTV